MPASVFPRYTVEPNLSLCLWPDEKKQRLERACIAERKRLARFESRGEAKGRSSGAK
ncbi:hypothetical protein MHH60_32375 [Paenibacillus sp. FSL H7-0716]|uniref:hypothetical protein n=1 Tax=Paenibacillus TaxID=44249 RepID=UPI0015C33AA3|nr:hypothetical protein [Paenibacillus odorifer]